MNDENQGLEAAEPPVSRAPEVPFDAREPFGTTSTAGGIPVPDAFKDALILPRAARSAHVYCGNHTRSRGLFEEPEECNYEGDVPLSECPEEDEHADWVCPGCGATNTVRDHS